MKPINAICTQIALAIFGLLQVSSPSLAQSEISGDQIIEQKPIRAILLGDKGHHRPADFAGRIVPVLAKVGIAVDYTEDVNVLANAGSQLLEYDCVIVFANITEITSEQEQGLINYVESGRGFVPVHCASFCFLNSDRYVQLVGAQFKEHGGERFATQIVLPEHPVMKGFGGFESWDETYTHHRHNPLNRTILETRVEGPHPSGVTEEPWTWIREQGRGRVFYTAWGHDERTWNQQGFHNLLERGIRWASDVKLDTVKPYVDVNRFPEPKMTTVPGDLPAFTYTEVGAQIPNYTPNTKWGVQGAPLTTMQNPLPFDESLKHYVTPQGFTMKHWASEGDENKNGAGLIGKPIAMNWDEKGRLWICETVDYPNELQSQGKGRDRIRICEDTDGDQVADKFTIFAKDLSIPTAIVHYRGGAIVQDGVKTIYLKDIDGDDRADFRQELITGWALGDTHGGVSNFQWGIDNWIYAMQGYNASTPVINGVAQQGFRQGFWRFAVELGKSDDTAPANATDITANSKMMSDAFEKHTIRVSKLEFLRATDNNTWGLGLSEEGLVFGSTANGNPSDFMPISNSYYERVKGWSPETLHKISDNDRFAPITTAVRQVDHFGGYTAAAGHALYTARKYPQSWWNRTAFVCEPTGHLVGAFVLSRDGAAYRSTSPFNLVASDDEWAAPIMAEVGPDGNVWVLDWYNYIVQHNPTPQGFTTGKGQAYESSLRDKKHGRVYRVEYQGNDGKKDSDFESAVAKNGLAKADIATLVKSLAHSNFFWRKQAQQSLIQKVQDLPKESVRATDTATLVESLCALIQNQSVDELGLNVGALHAIWTLNGAGLSNSKVTEVMLGALRHPSAAVRRAAIQVLGTDATAIDKLLASGLLDDVDSQVKLAGLLKIADATAVSKAVVLKLVSMTDLDADGVLLDAWTSATSVHAAEAIPQMIQLTKEKLDAKYLDRVAIISEHFARSLPNAASVAKVIQSGGDSRVQAAVLVGFEKGWAKSHTIQLDPSTEKILIEKWLEGDLPVDSKSRLLLLGTAWGVHGIEDSVVRMSSQLLEIASRNETSIQERLNAASQMISLQQDGQEPVKQLLALISPQQSPEMVKGIIETLRESRSRELGSLLLSNSSSYTPEVRGAIVRLLISRPETTRQLLAAITSGQIAFSELQLDQRQALREHPDPEIRSLAIETMKATGGVPNADRQKVLDAWMNVTANEGSLVNGKAMFLKHCSLCHIHGDIGVQIGPNLTGMAVHPKRELLMNILDPSRSVEGNFRTYSLLTIDGVVMTGMLAGESKTSVELINTQGKRETVLREDIEQLTASNKSLMPEGFESLMSREEMSDLLEFLTSKGKFVPLGLESVATVSSGRGLFYSEKNGGERLVFEDWSPKFVGDVPFLVVDPVSGAKPNIVMLRGPKDSLTGGLPTEVELVCNARVAAIHLLSGIGGWSYPAIKEQSVSMIVRLIYSDGETEDHSMINGVHMADYIRKIDVPESTFAFELNNGHQVRTLKVKPRRDVALSGLKLIKGTDGTAPIVMAVTIESP